MEVPDDILDELRSICLSLPDVVEEAAWVGTRWMIRQKNFAHVLAIEKGWPPAYARAANVTGTAFVLTFRSSTPVSSSVEYAEYPYFIPGWFGNIVGQIIDDDTDWDIVRSNISESYRILAPKRADGDY